MKKHVVIILIILLSIVVRLYGITSESYWVDEAISVQQALLPLSTNIVHTAFDVHPPLYNILIWFWVRTFGDTELSTRMMSLIFGVISVYVIYQIGIKLFDKKVALFAALVLAVSNVHIFYAQEARMYTLFTLLSALSFMYFINIYVLNKGSKNDKILYILFSLLLIYTHVFGWFSLIIQGIYVIMKKDFKKFREPFSYIFLFYLPWLPFTVMQIAKVQNDFWVLEPTFADLIETFTLFAGNKNLLLVFVVIVLLLVVYLLFKKEFAKFYNEHRDPLILLLMWFLIPILFTFLYSILSRPLYMTRYFLFCSLALYLLIGLSLKYIRYLSYPALILIIIMSIQGIQYQYEVPFKQNWNEAAFFLKSHLKEEDILIIQPHYEQHSFWYYYNKQCLVDAHWKTQCSLEPNIYPLDLLPDSKEFMKGKVVWFARNDVSVVDRDLVFLDWLQQNKSQAGYWHYDYIDLYRFE